MKKRTLILHPLKNWLIVRVIFQFFFLVETSFVSSNCGKTQIYCFLLVFESAFEARIVVSAATRCLENITLAFTLVFFY